MKRVGIIDLITSWLSSLAALACAFALGWLMNASGLYGSLVAATWPLVALLVAAAAYVFALPFLKHLPPLPRVRIPRRIDGMLASALGLFGATLGASALFRSGVDLTGLLGVLIAFVLGLHLFLWWRARSRADF